MDENIAGGQNRNGSSQNDIHHGKRHFPLKEQEPAVHCLPNARNEFRRKLLRFQFLKDTVQGVVSNEGGAISAGKKQQDFLDPVVLIY